MASIPKVAFVFTHQIQYFTNLMQKLHDRKNISLRVFYSHLTENILDPGFGRRISWDNCATTSFPSQVLPDSGHRCPKGFWSSFSTNLWHELNEFDPDVIHLNGFASSVQWVAWSWAVTHRKIIIARGDGDTLSRQNRKFNFARSLLARIFCTPLDLIFHQGFENIQYWIGKGANKDICHWIPCVSDNSLFRRKVFETSESRSQFRKSVGALDSDVVFVISGKLESRKRPSDVLRALKSISVPAIKVWFLGSGPLEAALKLESTQLGLSKQVHWWGFKNQSEIPTILQASDVLLHTSELDPWPYSILEGVLSGLPLILSDKTGSHPDLITDAKAGLSFQCGNIDDLASKIAFMFHTPSFRKTSAFNAASRASLHTEETFCEIMESWVDQVISNHRT